MTDASQPGALLHSEIAEQPARWRDLLSSQRTALQDAAAFLRGADPDLIVFAARGSSDHAAMFGQYLAHNLLGVPAMLFTPSTVTAFGTRLRYPRSVMLALSQSGESPDLLQSVEATVEAGVPVIAFTNGRANALASIATLHIDLAAGPELSVAASKTYTAELVALYMLLSLAAGQDWDTASEQIGRTADAAEAMIVHDPAAAVVERFGGVDRVLVVGRGYSMATAREAALKLMETCAIAASGWSAADAKHGPLGQIVDGTAVFALETGRHGRESVRDFASAASTLGATVFTSGPGPDAWFDVPSTVVAEPGDPALVPLLEIIPFQQLALSLAIRRGLDPDDPAGLSKVTKTV